MDKINEHYIYEDPKLVFKSINYIFTVQMMTKVTLTILKRLFE